MNFCVDQLYTEPYGYDEEGTGNYTYDDHNGSGDYDDSGNYDDSRNYDDSGSYDDSGNYNYYGDDIGTVQGEGEEETYVNDITGNCHEHTDSPNSEGAGGHGTNPYDCHEGWIQLKSWNLLIFQIQIKFCIDYFFGQLNLCLLRSGSHMKCMLSSATKREPLFGNAVGMTRS